MSAVGCVHDQIRVCQSNPIASERLSLPCDLLESGQAQQLERNPAAILPRLHFISQHVKSTRQEAPPPIHRGVPILLPPPVEGSLERRTLRPPAPHRRTINLQLVRGLGVSPASSNKIDRAKLTCIQIVLRPVASNRANLKPPTQQPPIVRSEPLLVPNRPQGISKAQFTELATGIRAGLDAVAK